MKKRTSIDFHDFVDFALRNYNEIVVISCSSLFILLKHYHRLVSVWGSSFFYFAALPLLTILFLLRKNPLNYGLRIGNWQLWIKYIFVFLLLALPILYISSDIPSVRRYYTSQNFSFLNYSLEIGIYLLGMEFLFRGFMLFGLKEKFKEGSILIQMIPFTILHAGKPEIEALGCIVTGILLGYIAYRGNSFWPAYIIHVVINISNKFFINFL
jgi:membrane protease YdiL (CAAX protease family)